ncbi:GNAT family N-acetyltransferase [Hymenobacter terricola]|uniref:GNAT family N-acetyltransferase n=1 Tax=Hymenobacter terricola TaxID=2819236 RepID=UPI001B311812|nr:GNAT family N-acetyltransferase [Hymenobacter terricola]
MNAAISMLTASETQELLPQLIALLQDAVDSGASIGFMPPMAHAEAQQFWQDIVAAVEAGQRVLLVARHPQTKAVLATGQLVLVLNPNAPHRAEVAKVMVHSQARRQGLGEQIMRALEAKARELGRTTLVLDTRHGDVSEQLYLRLQYQLVGLIPEYFLNNDGKLHATALYYKLLATEE